jgi:hypothetical protein
MIVELWKDADEIEYLGKRRQELARAKQRNPNSPKLGMPHGDMRDILGVRGEFAVARALGHEPDVTRMTAEGDPDPHYDGIYRGWKYEAKDTRWKTGQMVYQKKVHYLTQDVWILAVELRSKWVMKIAGWVWVRDMPDLWKPCHFDSSALCIMQTQLSKFKDFLSIDYKGHEPPRQGGLFQ